MNSTPCLLVLVTSEQIVLEEEMYSAPNILKHASSPPGVNKREA
ncbi:hypothetical protein [Alteromonas sp. KUL17]|nr:hypothetical protein [Alteromonas sp. KUL17]